MVSHERCVQQAGWTRELRTYLFRKAGLSSAKCVLEVGCGTGAILGSLAVQGQASLHGLDLSHSALVDCKRRVPSAFLTCGDAGSLPYPSQKFEIAYCHFLLLWSDQPLRALQEMKRVTNHGGYILALGEPDYSGRVDQPGEFSALGKLQTESLRRQGADVTMGLQLAELFHQAGIRILEAGPIQRRGPETLSLKEWEAEWAVLESDVARLASAEEIKTMILMEGQARTRGQPVLYVPTYFAWGQV